MILATWQFLKERPPPKAFGRGEMQAAGPNLTRQWIILAFYSVTNIWALSVIWHVVGHRNKRPEHRLHVRTLYVRSHAWLNAGLSEMLVLLAVESIPHLGQIDDRFRACVANYSDWIALRCWIIGICLFT